MAKAVAFAHSERGVGSKTTLGYSMLSKPSPRRSLLETGENGGSPTARRTRSPPERATSFAMATQSCGG